MKINLKIAALLIATGFMATALPLSAQPTINKVATDQAPSAIGPYSQAISAGSYLFISGQIALIPATGKLAGETIEQQTRQALNNIKAILAAEGMTLENVVKTEVYMKDLKDFAAMNSIYAEEFSYPIRPARATVQVSKLPLDALVEFSCIAINN